MAWYRGWEGVEMAYVTDIVSVCIEMHTHSAIFVILLLDLSVALYYPYIPPNMYYTNAVEGEGVYELYFPPLGYL